MNYINIIEVRRCNVIVLLKKSRRTHNIKDKKTRYKTEKNGHGIKLKGGSLRNQAASFIPNQVETKRSIAVNTDRYNEKKRQ